VAALKITLACGKLGQLDTTFPPPAEKIQFGVV